MNLDSVVFNLPSKDLVNLWIDENNGDRWAKVCRDEIALWLAAIAGERPGTDAVVNKPGLHISPPSSATAKAAFKRNTTLLGGIDLRWLDQTVALGIPLPFNGAFLVRRERLSEPLVSVWTSWLGEAPGFRVVRPTSIKRRSELEWRVGLPGGFFVGGPLRQLTPRESEGLKKQAQRLFAGPELYPEWLRDVTGRYGPRGTWLDVHSAVLSHASELPEPTDADDLDHRILITFPVWLRHRLSSEFLRALLKQKDENLSGRVLAVLRDGENGNEQLAHDAWSAIHGAQDRIAMRIAGSIHSVNSVSKVDAVDPINPVDLASRITRVRRLHMPSTQMGEIPAEYRQNHPSFRGRLCPVESPESEMVGLSLQLAAGASVDFDGRIQAADRPADELGFGAGLIPFFGHNDGARNMMGAKNLRQAVPLLKRQAPAIRAGGEEMIQEFTGPLVEIGFFPDANAQDGSFALGRDFLVAYLPWHGMNFEDAIVVGQHVVDQGLLDIGLRKRVRRQIKPGWIPTDPHEMTVIPWSEGGLAKEGTTLFAGSPIAAFAWEGRHDAKRLVVRHDDRSPAVLKSIRFRRRSEWTGGLLEYEVEAALPVRPGDKLMGRHGNKGVVGAILPEDRMPRLPLSERLPQSMRGRPIDILLNPHGVISRMNLGQLIETHAGWLLHSETCAVTEIQNPGSAPVTAIGRAFDDFLDHDRIQALLERSGLDRYGRTPLVLPGGEQTAAPVTVGFQHIARLRHVPELKSQARRGGRGALYNLRTGQAVQGRRLGGGQRLGEMEVWALAGHQAEELLHEFLGFKSCAELVPAPPTDSDGNFREANVGFGQTLKDWLFALLIDLNLSDAQVALSCLDPEDVVARIGAGNGIVNSRGLESRLTAPFVCAATAKKHPCEFRMFGGVKIAVPQPDQSDAPRLLLDSLLEHIGLCADGRVRKRGRSYILPLRNVETGTGDGALQLEFEPLTDQLKAVARPAPDQFPSGWPRDVELVRLYGRFFRGKELGGGNFPGVELIQEFLKEDGARSVGEMRVTCNEHGTVPLKAEKPFGEILRGVRGGLFDPMIFGSLGSGTGHRGKDRWGYIELPVEVPYPLHLFLTARRSKEKQEQAVEVSCRKHGIDQSRFPGIRCVPVLPVRYRSPVKQDGELVADELERRAYAPLIDACGRFAAATDEGKRKNAAQAIGRHVETLFDVLIEAMRGKKGLIRQHGLGRRVDRSARLVITPNPLLRWDQAGVPTMVLVELMGDLVEKWRRTATAEMDKTESSISALSWLHPKDDLEAVESARACLNQFLEANPDFVVLLNRQPSLHRDSFQAFHPVPLPASAGEVIQLCPLTCAGFAADFDGDEMVVHVPVDDAAQAEAAKMLPSRNLVSLATGKPLAHLDQDFVMGTFWLGVGDELGMHQAFLDLLPGDCCRELVRGKAAISKNDAGKLLGHLVERHPREAPDAIWKWMDLAFHACTRAGVSFGYYELRDTAAKLAAEVRSTCEEPDLASVNDKLQEIATGEIKRIVEARDGMGAPGLQFAAMAESGARGKKQVRQLIAARGLLEPGATGFLPDPAKFFFARSLADGLDPDEAFWAAMNARSSMCDKKLGTGHAGALTRELVFALWPFQIVSEDCGSKVGVRGVITCEAENGCCATCYGALPDGSSPPVGFPAGLIAAQSIGERGTQLSMQSFHTGQRAFSIATVRAILAGRDENGYFSKPENATRFVADLKRSDAYRDVLDRHFHVLWKAIHRSPGKSLRSAVEARDFVAAMAFHDQARVTALAAATGAMASSNDPAAKVIFAGFGSGLAVGSGVQHAE